MAVTKWHGNKSTGSRRRFLAVGLLSVLFYGQVLSHSAVAAELPLGTPWDSLTQYEQTLLVAVRTQWDSFTPERQERMRRGVARWQQMAPEERERAQQQQRLLEQMPSQQRDLLNQRIRQFNSAPQVQQQRLREIQRQFRSLPLGQRDALRQRFDNLRTQRSVSRPESLTNPLPPLGQPDAQALPPPG